MTGRLDGRSTNHKMGWGLGFSLCYLNKPRAGESARRSPILLRFGEGVVRP